MRVGDSPAVAFVRAVGTIIRAGPAYCFSGRAFSGRGWSRAFSSLSRVASVTVEPMWPSQLIMVAIPP